MRRPTLKRVRNWTPTGSPRPVVRLVTPLPAFAEEPPTIPAIRSDIRELRPTAYEVEEETLVRIPSSPPPPKMAPRPPEPSREDEALDALVGAYVAKASQPPPAIAAEPEPPPPAPMVSERRTITRPKPIEPAPARVDARAVLLLSVMSIALTLDTAVTATEEWLGSLDMKQRVLFIAMSAAMASLLTFVLR